MAKITAGTIVKVTDASVTYNGEQMLWHFLRVRMAGGGQLRCDAPGMNGTRDDVWLEPGQYEVVGHEGARSLQPV